MKIIEQIKSITDAPHQYRYLIVNTAADKIIRQELFNNPDVQVSVTNLYGLNYYVSNWFYKPQTPEDTDAPTPEQKPQYILSEMNLHQIASQYNVLMSDTQDPKTIEQLIKENVLFVTDWL